MDKIMALEIIDEPPKEPWSTKKCIIYAIISLIVGSIIFTFAYIGMSRHTGMGTLNQPILSWIVKHRHSQITDIMKMITAVASPMILTSIIGVIVIAWAIINREIWRPILTVITVGIATAVSIALKFLIKNGRPPQLDMIKPLETDYSFPSGHTISIIVLLLIIGYLIYSRRPSSWRVFGWLIITIIGTIIIATSRLYLGYHWLTDVIASIGLGFIILAIAIFIDRIVISRLEN
jgi:undecaprenyl-diphosphatase